MPASRILDPTAAPPLRWGVLGTGWIAGRFTGSLRRNTRQQVVAVGSRSVASAKAFADEAGIGRAHGSYDDLVADPEVDVIYVATPHNHHHRHALLALDAGKHVLVEKPIGLNAAEAAEIAERATERGVFCAEALWTFFLPRFDVVRQLLDDGVLGDVRTLMADHGEWFPDTHRILRHDLAGGALLDLGTYPLAFASWVLGEPERIMAVGQAYRAARSMDRSRRCWSTPAGRSRSSTRRSWRTRRTGPCSPGPAPRSSSGRRSTSRAS
jgi:predicted dehydrogenase